MTYKYHNLYNNGKCISEHKYIWEHHNREIPLGCEIHHKNWNKKDNKIENLSLMSSYAHKRLHRFYPTFNPNSKHIFKLGYTSKGYNNFLIGLPSKFKELLKSKSRICDIVQEWDRLWVNNT